MTTAAIPIYQRPAVIVACALLALMGLRLAGIMLTSAELYADEAQYWRWSRTIEWGYYSKPPMIAWVIAATTAIFGNGEWAVRLAAPILHTGAATALFLLGRDMYGSRTGMLAALGYILMPGVGLSASVISTDGVLLPFWCGALFCLWRLRKGQLGWAGAVILG
ncbi:MAG: glycosyltransferase family 39 protein, partial [Pseudomonadota bacterium]